MIDWLGALICSIAGFILGLFVIKDVLVAYLAGVWLMIPWLWFRTHDPAHLLYALVVNAIFMVTLIPEIQAQLKARREGKNDVTAGLQSFPMGRGMLKIMQKFGVHKG